MRLYIFNFLMGSFVFIASGGCDKKIDILDFAFFFLITSFFQSSLNASFFLCMYSLEYLSLELAYSISWINAKTLTVVITVFRST